MVQIISIIAIADLKKKKSQSTVVNKEIFSKTALTMNSTYIHILVTVTPYNCYYQGYNPAFHEMLPRKPALSRSEKLKRTAYTHRRLS